jgi:hypothetical protein
LQAYPVSGTICHMNRSQLKRSIWIMIGLALCLGSLVMGVSTALADEAALQQSATPTVSSNQVVLPTATPTIIGGPTATPSRTPTLVPVLAEAIGEANLRSGPGLDFDIIGMLTNGNPVPIVGRSLRFPWYAVEWADGPNGQAWVFDQLVIVIGDITTVPIVGEPELPTIDPTQAVIQMTATVLLQTPGAAETATATAFFAPTGVFTQTPGAAALPPGVLPTFTPPGDGASGGPIIDVPSETESTNGRGPRVSPAVIILSLGGMGLLTLLVGLLRRF